MKILKILPFLSIVFAVVLTLGAVSALGEPQQAVGGYVPAAKSNEISVVGVARAEENAPLLDLDKLEEIINLNRVFDDYIYDGAALVDEALFVLRNQAEELDGKQIISCEAVNGFVAELYGREIEKSETEYYEIGSHGYTETRQEIVSAVCDEGGTVTVTADMYCSGCDGVSQVVTKLAPAANSFGYIILSAEIAE